MLENNESIDCLLLSSLAEGTPNIIGEAVIMTKPFISTRVGDTELSAVTICASSILVR